MGHGSGTDEPRGHRGTQSAGALLCLSFPICNMGVSVGFRYERQANLFAWSSSRVRSSRSVSLYKEPPEPLTCLHPVGTQ